MIEILVMLILLLRCKRLRLVLGFYELPVKVWQHIGKVLLVGRAVGLVCAVGAASDVLRTASATHWQHIAPTTLFVVERIAHESHLGYLGKRHCALADVAYS